MADTVTIVGSLAHLDLTAYRDASVQVDVYSAPSGSAIETGAAPGVTAPADYVPTAYVGSRVVVSDDQGLWGAELPWQEGVVLRVTVPGDGTWFAVLGTGAGKIAAGATVNYRDLTPASELVAPSTSLDAIVAEAIEEALLGPALTAQIAGSIRAATPLHKALLAGTARVLVMGDSKASGAAASSMSASWQRLLLARLRTATGLISDQGIGYIPAYQPQPGVTPAPTLAGGAQGIGYEGGLGNRQVSLPIGGAVTWPSTAATRVTFWWSKTDFFAGTADLKIDGATVGTINSVGTGKESGFSSTYTVAAGTHAASAAGTFAGGSARVDGAFFETDPDGIKLIDGSHGGWRADLYAFGMPEAGAPTAHDRHWEAVAALAPHIAILAVGANDMASGLPGVAAWTDALAEIYRRLQLAAPGCGLVLLTGTARTQDVAHFEILRAYESAARKALGDKPHASVLTESELWLPTHSPTAGAPDAYSDPLGWLADGVHPTDLGHARIAEYLTDRLLSGYPASAGGGGGVTDHGALTGLGDDDHPHYLTAARGDARYVQPGSLAPVATTGDYASLTGTVPTSALPPLAINTVSVVATQSAMLALTAERGDMAIRTDTGRTYVLASDSPATLADWKEVTAAGQVVSVAGRTGAVSLTKADVGLGSVDNTSDAAKAFTGSQITSGTVAYARLPVGTAASTVAAGDDTRIISGAVGRYAGVNAQTGTTYTAVLGDEGKLVTLSNAAAVTVTLPTDAAAAIPVGGRIDFAALGTGMATFVAASGATAVGTPSLVTRAQYSAASAIKTAANAWLVVGDLAG